MIAAAEVVVADMVAEVVVADMVAEVVVADLVAAVVADIVIPTLGEEEIITRGPSRLHD